MLKTQQLDLMAGDKVASAVIDTANGFAYFGTTTIPGKIIKVNTSTFTVVDRLILNSGENIIQTGVIDSGFAYFGTYTTPGKIVKVNLSNFTRVGVITLNSGNYETDISSAVIDSGFAYFGTTYINPGRVIRVNLSNFTYSIVGTTYALTGAATLSSGYAYFGTYTTPGGVYRIRLSDFTNNAFIIFSSGEIAPGSAVTDDANGFAYFGSSWYTPPTGKITKVNLSNFTRTGVLSLDSGTRYLDIATIDTSGNLYFVSQEADRIFKVDTATFTVTSSTTISQNFDDAEIDTVNNFIYYVSSINQEGRITKFDISNFVEASKLILNIYDDLSFSPIAIDSNNGFAYLCTRQGTYTNDIVKVNLSDFTRVGSLTLNSGEIDLSSPVIDSGFLYFGTSFTPNASIVKVNLSDFTRVGSIILNSGESEVASSVIDTDNGYAYFGVDLSGQSQDEIIKLDLSTFTRVDTLILNSGDFNLDCAIIDTQNGFAYFGTVVNFNNTDNVIKINLSNFTRVDALTLNSGEYYLYSAIIDTTNGFAYFTSTTGRIVKIRLSDFTRIDSLYTGLNWTYTSVIDTINGYAYIANYLNPVYIAQVRLSDFTITDILRNTIAYGFISYGFYDRSIYFGAYSQYQKGGEIIKITPRLATGVTQHDNPQFIYK